MTLQYLNTLTEQLEQQDVVVFIHNGDYYHVYGREDEHRWGYDIYESMDTDSPFDGGVVGLWNGPRVSAFTLLKDLIRE